MKDVQYNLQQTSINSTCSACRTSCVFLPLYLVFFFLTTGLTLSFLHLCLIASAPPYNHIGSQLSFGVVYIAVIVRVQCRDWAQNVYSLTRKLCNKSGSGEEWGLGGGGGAIMYVRTHKITFTFNTMLQQHGKHRVKKTQ